MSPTLWLERCGWVLIEAGWWSHAGLGGICRERDEKWYAYPLDGSNLGPFRTCKDAAIHCAKPKLCGAETHMRDSAEDPGKFRACERPVGHSGRHMTTYCGKRRYWVSEKGQR